MKMTFCSGSNLSEESHGETHEDDEGSIFGLTGITPPSHQYLLSLHPRDIGEFRLERYQV
jgi:hypothetical protein